MFKTLKEEIAVQVRQACERAAADTVICPEAEECDVEQIPGTRLQFYIKVKVDGQPTKYFLVRVSEPL